jgi:cytochrome oxidase Cu insertion factor (SCO1/SenC/PrrC family)
MKYFSATTLLLLMSVTATVGAEIPAGGEVEQTEHSLVSRYMLMDTSGHAITDRDFPGSFQLISFGYTYCPDICPTTLAEMSLIMKRLGELSERLQPIFITVDPERDTPERLNQYTAFFHPQLIGLTGSPELVRRVADNFKVRYEKHYEPGGNPESYSVDHSAGMYLLGQDGRFEVKFAFGTPVSQVTEQIRSIIENTTPLPPARRLQ